MKLIKKGKEPASLREHRSDPRATYEGYSGKDELREALAREQGFLCCYCMSRISADERDMKIEHRVAQSKDKDRALAYPNMHAACRGGDGERAGRKGQHCDTHKADADIVVNPTDPSCESKIRYRSDGEITSADPEVRRDLDQTLNLNLTWLKKNRREALDDALLHLRKKHQGEWTGTVLSRELKVWSDVDGEGRFREYCQFVIYFLEKRLKREGA